MRCLEDLKENAAERRTERLEEATRHRGKNLNKTFVYKAILRSLENLRTLLNKEYNGRKRQQNKRDELK